MKRVLAVSIAAVALMAAGYAAGQQQSAPPTVHRVVTTIDKMPMDTMMKVAGADAPKRGLPPKHPMMHRTRTVDYAIILSGEIDMMMDDSTVHLKAGDVVVQQATNHAWINHSKAPCRVAFILMDSQDP